MLPQTLDWFVWSARTSLLALLLAAWPVVASAGKGPPGPGLRPGVGLQWLPVIDKVIAGPRLRFARGLFGLQLGFAALCVATTSCYPLTLSNDGPIDFARYPAVYVAPVIGPDSGFARSYLVDELRESSGFSKVTTDAAQGADVELRVEIDINLDFDSSSDEDPDYEGKATFVLTTPDGEVVDRDAVQDSSSSEQEALEDTLDELVQHYLFPYRI